MTVLFPEATSVLGNLKVVVVDAIADMAAPKVATEINAATSLDISCFVRGWNPEITTNTGTAPSRLCTTLDLPQEGKTSIAAVAANYVYDPQAADSTADNKAKAKLVKGYEGFVVVRKGLPFDVAFAAGQKTEVWKIRTSRQNFVQSGDDEYADFEIQQMVFPISLPVYGTTAA